MVQQGTTTYTIRYYFWCISGARARNTYQDCTSLVPGMYLHLGVRVRGVYQRTGMRVPRLYLSTLPRRNDMVHGRGEQRRPRQVPQAWARPIVNRDYSCDLKIRLFARLLVEIVAPCEGSGSFLSRRLSFLSLSQEYSFVAGCDKINQRVGFVAGCDKND